MITDAEIKELRKRNPFSEERRYYKQYNLGYITACDELEKMQKEIKE